ncbi:hypothetical protein H0264_25475 [Nocardia huaxiensis]|uniref:Uncharacterized protein n=1 Tax=Nocardia huaxiensis TaxID=2755382 RepID=A0A7D6V821_9NOCA|nr:hypothetical protein [Nocardia huaxiensis]QLY28671.1 hypothetical protein H0264_25475 [Nocardia huaxiensis]
MLRVLVTALSAGLSAALFSTVVPVAIWPGEAKLTAPLFCESGTEPMVVSDTFHDSEGTSTNYTLYCVGEHGSLTNEGFALPMLVLFIAHVLILTALILLAGWIGQRRRPVDATVPDTHGPKEFDPL